jgi:hypothetical protein
MSFLDDFASAVNGYPAASVTLAIVDRSVVPPGVGPAVTVNAVWAFHVRVTNNGRLNMAGLRLLIEGMNGAMVSTAAAGPFAFFITPPALPTLNARGSQETENFYFRAPSDVKAAGTALVRAYIISWDANLDHILKNCSVGGIAPAGIYSDQVSAA